MPVGAKILTVREHFDQICILALVDPSPTKTTQRQFVVYAAGDEIHEKGLDYVGTAVFQQGAVVFHVFEHR